jgi:outer membrane protein OmpA-like peptidoglycan-associated protein
VWNAGNPAYTITYSGNTNTGGVVPSPTVGSGSVTLAANSSPLVKTAFNFGGWNTKADGTGTSYATRSNYNLTANITLYAVWSASTIYTITYLGNGSTGGTVPTPTLGSGLVVLATNSGGLTKTGYTFSGWNTKADRSGASYLVGGNYNLTANATLYAAYIPLPISQTIPDIIANGKIINTAPQKKIALNQIVPVHQQFITVLPNNAVGFELYENGRLINRGTSSKVDLTQIVGPKDRVTVIAVSKDGLKSDPAPVSLEKEPISLANINFNTDSYKFIGPATKILDQVAAVIIQHGYTVLEIWGYVDTQGSKASWITLSNNRAKAVKDYMTKKLKGSGVLIKNAGRAQTQAVGNNNTAEGRALNRRVEIRVS